MWWRIAAVMVLCIGAYLLGRYTSTPPMLAPTAQDLDFSAPTPYLDAIAQQCPDDVPVSDRFVCIAAAASSTLTEADTLAQKLTTQAPLQLKQLLDTGPAPWEYGGEEFLKDVPWAVTAAQKARDAYFEGVCFLDSMVIYGGSGMDLEREACRYYYANDYLSTLKRLEEGVVPQP